jgi:hypothetical protein
MLDELPHRHLYPTKKKFWMQRLRRKKGVLPSGGRTSCVTKISVAGVERRNARPDDTPSVPLAPETERSRGHAGQLYPLTFRAILSAWFPRSPWGREAQDALRHRSVPTREPACRTGRRGNERISDGTLARMTRHQFLLLQRQSGLEDRADKFHPLTLRAIRRNILPSPAPNNSGACPELHLGRRGTCPDSPRTALWMPAMDILRREHQSTWQDSQSARYNTGTAKRKEHL